MPSYAVLLCSAAALLGTLVASPLAPDLRAVVGVGVGALGSVLAFARWPIGFAALMGAIFTAAALDAQWQMRAQRIVVEARTARYAATVLDGSSTGDGTTALALLLDDGSRVAARVNEVQPAAGTRIVVRGRLEPFDEPRNPGEPSEAAIERERGFDARIESARILFVERRSVRTPQSWLANAHAWAKAQLRERIGDPAASVVAGELWGERSALPPDLRAEFQETGTVHVLVTAGLHLGAVAALCVAILTLLALPRPITCAATIALVWAFVWWSGEQLPAIRAATMASVALTARACGRATFSWNALAIAAFVLALARPQSVATTSFALSFSCVGAIFACAAPLDRWIETHIALPRRMREALVLSIATQAGVWPLGAATFLQFTPYAVLANAAIVPCVAATMALGTAQLALAWCAPLAQALANCNSWLLAWMLAVVTTIAGLPWAAIAMTPPPAWCIAAYDAALAAAPILLRYRSQRLRANAPTLAAACVLITTAYVLWPPRPLQTRLRVTVLDVGQADAIVIQTPRGHALLVDAGGRLERGSQNGSVAEAVGERIVVPFLIRQGIHAVDAIILSHPHGDHAGGVAPALRRLRVAQLADSGQRYGGHAFLDALATAHREGVPIIYPRAGMLLRTDDGVAFHFLGPSLPLIANSRNDINENSIAFTVRYGSFCMLFTGDAGATAEQRFLAQRTALRCDILKVGHHGSAYGSTPHFIAAVHPRQAIISVGRHNVFGHPAQATLETLRRYGALVYRTDEDGAVTILSDGRTTTLWTMVEKRKPPGDDRRLGD